MHNQQAFLAAVVVAGGSGSRMGGPVPKQFLPLGGKPVFRWSIDALLQCEEIDAIVLVVPGTDVGRMPPLLPTDPRLQVVAGGEKRTDSVRAGLEALAALKPEKVLIHDAARPGLTPAVIRELIAALNEADAVAPALPVTDALKDPLVRSVPREGLVRVQTPQGFRYPVIRGAVARTPDAAVDELALIEQLGVPVKLTPGRHELMKITHPEDVAIVERLIAPPPIRVGTGFDVHGFEPGDHVMLCGVRIPHTRKLKGHSDADAGWHALTDAILGAAALGDIGQHFPPSDPKWKGADSRVFLQHAAKLAADAGLKVVNADITIICERPKISPYREMMQTATAEALGVDRHRVSVKATTTEGLGFAGREEGIAAQAIVMLAGW